MEASKVGFSAELENSSNFNQFEQDFCCFNMIPNPSDWT